jgi:hypothetical protein
MMVRDFFKQEEDDFDSHEDEAGFLLVLSDTFMSFLAVVLCVVCLLMLAEHSKSHPPALNTTGALCVELTWPNDRNIDLDLWGHSPGDPDTVGFSNMHGKDMNLLRDVIGFNGNPTHTMLEMTCADRLTPGEWIFNVHYFANHEAELDKTAQDDPRKTVKATMFVRVKNPNSKGDLDSLVGDFTLTFEKEEKTMFRFVITPDGKIDHATVNSKDMPLKRGWPKDGN